MLEEKVKFFKALSDPNRLRILKMLQSKPLCVCEITAVLKLATSTVSKHLSTLKQSGFIKETKNGKWIDYSINIRPDDQRVSSILSSLDFWIDDDEVIIKDKKRVKNVDRHIVCGS